MASRHWLLSMDSRDRPVRILHWHAHLALYLASCAFEKEHEGVSNKFVPGCDTNLFQHYHPRHHIVL